MGEPKPLASLSSSLLARKGQAKPAMRPQGFANFGFGAPHAHEDLGWNDMGHDHVTHDHGLTSAIEPTRGQVVSIVPETIVHPEPSAPPAVVLQQEELARELASEPIALAAPAPRAAAGSKGKAAFTLRLDPDRHLRLRLVCAVTHKSAQAVVIAALDAFLSSPPAAAALAEAAHSSGQGTVA